MHRSCPFPGYAQLRREAPVRYERSEDIWIVSRYEDVRSILRDSRSFSTSILGAEDFEIYSPATGCPLPAQQSLLGSDSPVHESFRSMISPFFTLKAIEGYEALSRSVLHDALRTIGPAGRCEIIGDLCMPAVASMIGQVLGLKPHRFSDVAHWMEICGRSNARSRPPALRPAFEIMMEQLWSTAQEQYANKSHGLFTALMEWQEAGGLEDAQVLDFVVAILKGGADTTSYLVGNALVTWHEQPSLVEAIRSHPGLLAEFIEESLRYDSPVQMSLRVATADVELSGTKIVRGSRILLLLGSANHDETVFDDAEAFHLNRPRRHHLAFGAGVHMCPGALIGRRLACAILEAVLSHMKSFAIVLDAMRPVDRTALRGFEMMKVTFHAFRLGE